ncbi:MAG: cupin domain-containing protein [Solirubrobacterales bacterium]|nr:cupin domain-containing protein [Solirubrobacterales bacterium]MBV9473784.1 cupin domain-containing protein [Solirubrobacterales bacterium]MBV9838515.1 cupin domain-containing protein [Solirubrobacterales bacterium]
MGAAGGRFNVFTDELDVGSDRDGFSWRGARVAKRIGAERIGASLYELERDQQTFPFHFHHGVEEWLYVVAGNPTLRTPAERAKPLGPGDLVCFPAGASGAHALRGPGRVLILSANRAPSIAVYPDSDKLGTRPGGASDRLNFRRADAVDYWEGE